MFVSIIGNDGSGKTSIIKEIKNIYEEKGNNVIYLKEFETPIISFIKKILYAKVSNTNNEVYDQGNNNKSLIYFFILWLDNILEYYFYKIFYCKSIIIKDRFFYDYIATLIELGKYNGFMKFLYNFFPKGDLTFFIKVTPENTYERHKRKTEKYNESINSIYNKEFYIKKYDIYNKVLNLHKNIIIIDNNKNLKESISKVKTKIDNKILFNSISEIVISGIDGAGKTTTINNIKKLLNASSVKYVEIHFYYNYIIIKFIKLIKELLGITNKKTLEEQYEKSLETEQKAIKSNKSIFWIIFVLSDSIFQYIWVKIIGIDKVKLIDRFFPDYIVSWDFIGVKYNKNIFKYLPKAKNYFLLVAPPEILYKRKPEHSLDFFEKCYNDYLKLSKEFNIHLIDTSKYSEDEVVEIIINNLKGTIK